MLGVLLSPLLLLSSAALAAEAAGPSAASDSALGTSAAKGLSPSVRQAIESSAVTAAVTASPIATFSKAQYATAGVALRNRQTGAIQISGVVGPVKRAYLYWAFLFGSAPPATQAVVLGPPGAARASATGSLIATGADTCWRSSGIAVYRADVTSLVSGNGLYSIALPRTASATNSGADPWTSLTLPAAEGAALVVVGAGTRNVAVFDKGIAGATFFGSTSYTLNVPGGVKTAPVLWDNIGADGQTGVSVGGRGFGVAKEKTYVNDVQIAGPGTDVTANGVTGSDWDGGVGSPLPQLWDVTGRTLPVAAAPVGKPSLAVRFVSVGQTYDCATPIANVIAY
ncbi:hypothetical protein [Methylosinus sp. Sm6]|uniref:hypothetical protein n=1 Tax=Methylosinus sp. Sm6 TaxID=2866948 RepID=UPI001C99B007|nr:hypothetical protein [Methylosinus sp. Sm6]MBY6242384.1 hypothetical protein [Methylosinus sp. Sm6]